METTIETEPVSVPKKTVTTMPELTSDPSKIKIPGQEYLCYEIELTGILPGVLMNRLDESVLSFPGVRSMDRPAKGNISKTKPPKAAASNIVASGEAAEVAHVDLKAAYRAARGVSYLMPGSDTLCCPVDNLQAMLLAAARRWPGSGLLQAAGASLFFEENYLPFLHPTKNEPMILKPQGEVDLVYHTRMKEPTPDPLILVKPAKSSRGNRILTARVFLSQWRLIFRVLYDAVMISKKAAEEILLPQLWTFGGGHIGLMSWRPGAEAGPGPHGRYQVTKYKFIK